MKNLEENLLGARIKKISFNLLSQSETKSISVHELKTKDLYDIQSHKPMPDGPLDTRLGVSTKNGICQTCKEGLATCVGHFGHINLVLPCFHIGLIKQTIFVLSCICKSCGNLLLSSRKRMHFRERKRNVTNSNELTLLLRKVATECKKTYKCECCGLINGTIKKNYGFKLFHEIEVKNSENEASFNSNHASMPIMQANTPNIVSSIKVAASKAKKTTKHREEMNPLTVLNLFKLIPQDDYEIIGQEVSPERFILQSILVPPACIRPSVQMDDNGINEDDITIKISEILHTNKILEDGIERGNPISMVSEDWDHLQLQISLLYNSDLPQINLPSQPIRGIVQRLKGKTGRFRCNLSGKRVDFSGRTVISPDPNLSIEEVGIPEHMAKILTIPEKVTNFNKPYLDKLISNGPLIHPGANYVVGSKFKKYLLYGKKECQVGDIVERHLCENDVVLFNRQPSLHKMSIMAHRVKIHKDKTLRFNECVCTPYNADFDGDEMNIHVPQTLEARAEAIGLMGVAENILTSRNGEPLIAATQDFITAMYLITSKDVFFTRERFAQLCSYFTLERVRIKPSIKKPVELFSGKQLIEILIRDSLNLAECGSTNNASKSGEPSYACKPGQRSRNVLFDGSYVLTLKSRNKSFIDTDHPNDGQFVVINNTYYFGRLDKALIGAEDKKNSLIYELMKLNKHCSVKSMNSISKLASRYLGEVGFSIGLNDVQPGPNLQVKKAQAINEGYKRCNQIIDSLHQKSLSTATGVSMEETAEMEISYILNKIREKCGSICMKELSMNNSSVIMQVCGSKGSKINVAQMIACVGQQIISGTRIPDGMHQRCLPHFPKRSITPQAKGFVFNSFYSGLRSEEFFFHAVSGREGLVDTAVKTAETGYMQRRLMKALEDLSVAHDLTVRNSNNEIVQYIYGDDNVDPIGVETDDIVDFEKIFTRCKSLYVARRKIGENEVVLDVDGNLDVFEVFNSPTQINFGNISKSNASKEVTVLLPENNRFSDPSFQLFQDPEKGGGSIEKSMLINTCFTNFFLLFQSNKFTTQLANNKFCSSLLDFMNRKLQERSSEHYCTDVNFVNMFLFALGRKIMSALIEPGTAVGAVAGQSIGEPGTQMTLKTFHFAGVSSMNITLGVPRLKEIINAITNINTPLINARLCNTNGNKLIYAKEIKGRIERIALRDVCSLITEQFGKEESSLLIHINQDVITNLMIPVTISSIKKSLALSESVSIIDDSILKVSCKPSSEQTYFNLQRLKKQVRATIISGIPEVSKAIINESKGVYALILEGHGLRKVLNTEGVDFANTTSNSIIEIQDVLGIEAAREQIISEIEYTIGKHGIKIDPRHIMLLADTMTYRGEILGITRFGISKMSYSTLMLASFEQTSDHLFDAAVHSKRDAVCGVSESIILGIPISIGTGSVDLYWQK